VNASATPVFRDSTLIHPSGERLRLNKKTFVAMDWHKDATYEPLYRPQALYDRASNGFHANHDALLIQEVATNLPIYNTGAGPTNFHLHLPPGGFQFMLVTSRVFTFNYDGRTYHLGPGAAVLQRAIVHRQAFYSWSGLSTMENLKTLQIDQGRLGFRHPERLTGFCRQPSKSLSRC
jgi:hypothetical protein